ncbi:MAG TPA: phosphatidylserine decarboxylase, partial [Thiolinea sp.]|nr:phosphatidylserine decarboxylase [Thiolinea sp.]
MPISDYLKSWPLYVLPHHTISRVVYRLTRLESKWTPAAIRKFIQVFKIDMSEAVQSDPSAYKTFNAFFTRSLKPELRPLATEANVLVSPVDGTISQVAAIREGRIIQAKNFD